MSSDILVRGRPSMQILSSYLKLDLFGFELKKKKDGGGGAEGGYFNIKKSISFNNELVKRA